ncbi:hypothetical protein HYT84_03095 [Candidatus Micrarchaeota archaeon]|nr:hypothetical protein [Candidatus Micrarchaeota archaeon]
MTDLISYYKDSNFDLNFLDKITFRHFRFKLFNGKFVKIIDRIRNSNDLKKHIFRNNPSDIFYSTSCWLAPEKIGLKRYSKDIMLSSDLFFDLDINEKIKTLDEVRLETSRLIDFINDNSIKLRYIAFSGSKGFHVSCYSEDLSAIHYKEREVLIKDKRENLVKEIRRAGIEIDRKVTVDTRRIVRLPGTINSKTGYICTILKQKELDNGIKEMFKNIKRVKVVAPLSESNENKSTIIAKSYVKDRFGVRSSPFFYSTFLTNYSFSNLWILFLQFPLSFKFLTQRIKLIQRTYEVGDVYVFKDRKFITAMCLQTFQRRRIEKILKAAKSSNLNSFLKYGRTFFRVGNSESPEGKVLEGPPLFSGIIKSPYNNKPVSKGHHIFLKELINLNNCGNLHGKDHVEIVHSIISNK